MNSTLSWWRAATTWLGGRAAPRRAGRSRRASLCVLLYHKVLPRASDPWSVSPDQFAAQLDRLCEAGYAAISCRDLVRHLDGDSPLADRAVLITFDDAYVNNVEYALPLLSERGLRATLFAPTAFLGQTNLWDRGDLPLLSADELRSLDPAVLEIGLHSHRHASYRQMSTAQIAEDLRLGVAALRASGAAWTPSIAYPYGGFPRGRRDYEAFREQLAACGIRCGFRIGNRLNRLPIADRYLIERVDIRREDSLDDFARKLCRGARRPLV